MATPTTSDFLVVPINGTDLIAFYRGSNISRPLYLRYSTFLDILSQSIGGGTTLLLETNGVQNPSQTLLNLIQGSGITITDNGTGGVTIAATGGASFITSISDTADIDLDVTLSDLTASLTTTGVTPNTYGSSTQVPQITVDSKGRITGVTLVNITAGTGSVISVATAGLISGGPITVSGTITTSMNTNKLVGRGTAGAGIMEEITLGTGLSLSGTTLNATGGGSSLNDTTGILFGGALSATIGGTTFSVTAGIGQIVTQTASITGVVTTASNVTWSAVTGAAITNIGTSQFTYVLVNSSGVVIQQTTPFTDAQYKTHIIIGILCHINLASVNLVTNAQNVAYEDPHRLVELITSFGPIKKLGLNIGPNGANLRVNRTSGEAFKIGTNYTTDQFEPDVSNIAAQTPALLCRVHRDGSGGFIFDVNGGSYYNDIDPSNYDNGSGTLQSVGGSKWTIQRLFFFPNNPADIICYYGVQTYNQFSEARANLEFETFDEAQITAENAVFLGFLFVRNAATNLSLTTQAVFLQSGLFRGIPPGGGGSGGGGNSIGELTGDVTTPAATAPSQSVPATLAASYKAGSAGVIFDGAGGVITTNTIGYVQVPYNGTITGWTLVSSVSGSCTVTAFKDTYGAFPPTTTTDDIFVTPPAISATNKAQNLSAPTIGLFGTVTAGDWIGFKITGVTTVTWVNLTLSITKTI
jgi:hypothetical protein